MSFAAAVRIAIRTAKRQAGLDVVYRRGDEAVNLRAVKVLPETPENHEGGLTLAADEAAWLIEAEDLLLAGETARPQERDTIELLVSDAKETYRVMPRDAGEPHCRPNDAYGMLWRVQTKLVKTDE